MKPTVTQPTVTREGSPASQPKGRILLSNTAATLALFDFIYAMGLKYEAALAKENEKPEPIRSRTRAA